MAVEIFVGMYLFRILSIGPVGFILAFIVSVSQSLVDLFPTPEDAVHRFLWVWVAVASAVSVAWVANVWLSPDPANRLLHGRKFADRPGLEEVSMGVEEIYVACLPWLRVQTRLTEGTQAGQYQRVSWEVCGWLARRMEKLAFLLESEGFQETGPPERLKGSDSADSESFVSRNLETLERSVGRLENLLQTVKQHS